MNDPPSRQENEAPDDGNGAPTAQRPWWALALPFLGGSPSLSRPQWRLLGLLTAAEFFDHYDIGLMSLALLQIQQTLQIPEAALGQLTAVVRLGAIPGIAFAVLADRVGRRRLLLVTILGFTLCTFATAFAQTPGQFMALQFLARMFMLAETTLAVVVLTEELAARHRGWAIGMLGAMGELGHGLSAIVFACIHILPYGWRSLYVVGIAPLLLLAWFRRGLRETRRFEKERDASARGTERRGWLHPLTELLRQYPARMAALCAALIPMEFVAVASTTFMAKTLQEVHGYSPGGVTLLYLAGGVVGITGNLAAGAWSDRFGRRRVMSAMLLAGMIGIYGVYNFSGWVVAPLWIAQVFGLMGSAVLFKAMGSELFPTVSRSTASGLLRVVGMLGGALGLALESTLYTVAGSHAAAITLALPVMLISPAVLFAFIPEPAKRELEEIAPGS